MAASTIRTAVWQIRPQRPMVAALAAVALAVLLTIAVVALKGQLPVHTLIHTVDRIPAPFRHGLFQASGGQLVEHVTHHLTHR